MAQGINEDIVDESKNPAQAVDAHLGVAPTTGSFDVFLSHNSRDKPTVERLAERLKRGGLEPWLDKWCLTPGGNWQNELVEGISASRACAFFIGPHGEGAWAREELHVALDRAAKDKEFRLFLVLLPGVEEPFATTALPPFLSTRTWVDLRKGVEDPRSFQGLIHAIKGIPLGPEVAIEPRDDVCPYQGLQTFDEQHAEYFFGRDADTQRLLEQLKTARFLAILGSSGSGKSSLVRAGLIPALKRGAFPGSERWPIRVLTPGAHPLESLAAQLVRLDPEQHMNRVLDQLAGDARALHLAVALAMEDRVAEGRLVLVVDQCEEIFTLCQDDGERQEFLDNLLYAATIPDGRCLIILTMRADFYPRCAAHPDFSSRVATQQFLVSPMDREGLRQCIEEPARRVGLELEPGLVHTILEDVGSQAGALPLLEHALLELWERRRGYVLTLEGYQESGGVHGAIAKRADTMYLGFTPHQQAIGRRVMLRLTQPGEGTEDTRRRASFRELVTRPEEHEAVDEVVKRLADARLLTVSGVDAGGEPLVDIAHEALIRSWPRLRSWLDETRAALRVQHRLAEAAGEWQRLERDEDLLYRGARLAEAVEWREVNAEALNEIERDFLDTSVAMHDRELAERERQRLARERLRRRVTAGLGIGLLVALLLGGLAALQWRAAVEQRRVADEQRVAAETAQGQAVQQRQVAFARQVAAQAEVVRNGRANLLPESVALAAESLERLRSPEAAQTLRRSLGLLARPVAGTDHGDYIQDIAYSPDGRMVATASNDRTARLWDASNGQVLAILSHQGAVQTLAFSPDGRYVATGSIDRTARLWETATGQEVARFTHADFVNAVAFSPDGRLLATASDDGTARLWDVATRQEVARLEHGDRSQVLAVTFSPDGRLLATANGFDAAGTSGFARVWSVATATEIARVSHGGAVRRVAFSPDGSQIATASEDRTAAVWDARTGAQLARFVHDLDVTRIAFSPDGRSLATGSRDGTARVWEVVTRREVVRLKHENAVNAVAFSPDGRYLATAGGDSTARIWNPANGQELARMPQEKTVFALAFSPNARYLATAATDGHAQIWAISSHGELATLFHDGGVVGVAFSPDGRLVATASLDKTARLWDAKSGRELARLRHDDQLIALAFSSDGRRLATASFDKTARIWDTTSYDEVARVSHDDAVIRVAFSPDGRLLATASDDHTARLWDATTGAQLAQLTHGQSVNRVGFSPDGHYLATGSEDGTTLLYDVVERTELGLLAHSAGPVNDISFSPDSRSLATASGSDRMVRLWDLSTRQEVMPLPHSDFISTVSFSPDGRYLASGTTDGIVRVWRTEDMQELPPRALDSGLITATVFSPDGRYLATASGDRTARLWDVTSGEELARFWHEREVIRVAFSPDGRQLATASLDGTARIWPVDAEDLIGEACARIMRNLTPEAWQQYFGAEPYHQTCPSLP